jgi:hypothetical protein
MLQSHGHQQAKSELSCCNSVHGDFWVSMCAGEGAVNFANRETVYSGVKWVIPEWWGAKGDGKSDDSRAIQRCHEAALSGELH